jgi:AGCS family alanine or glycine:cation symporter
MCCFFQIIDAIQEFLWGYVNFFLILAIGLYFSVKTSFFQFRALFSLKKTVRALMTTTATEKTKGVAPLRLYFTSIGGSIGLGNIVAVVTTVSIGGPGGIFWMWVAVFLGMLVKYGEVYLGITYRKQNAIGGYDGGPMYYLNKALNIKCASSIFCVLMCIYGVEIFQFKVVEDVIVDAFGLSRYLVMAILLTGTIYVAIGGVNRLSKVCTVLMPIFLIVYTSVCLFVISKSDVGFGHLLGLILKSAFTGHAAVGGFAGSTIIMAIQYGMANAVYSGDIGMGYDSVIQAETQLSGPKAQARTVVFTLFTDCFICTLTVLLVLSTGCWSMGYKHGGDFVTNALLPYFPYIKYLLAVFFFLVGWTTILGFLLVGIKSAKELFKKGKVFYLVYAVLMFLIFSFVDQNNARLIMYLAGALLMLMNTIAIFRLRQEIDFSID